MFIQTEQTPNPDSLKFIPGVAVLENGNPINFPNKESCDNSPLAKELFKLDYVKSVFLGNDFITITKDNEIKWEIIKPELLVIIMDYFISGNKVLSDQELVSTVDEDYDEKDKEIVDEIKELIEARVRPAVAQDGGDIVFRGFKNGIVYLQLQGACSGCPSSTVTLKDGIENLLKHYIPEIESVESI